MSLGYDDWLSFNHNNDKQISRGSSWNTMFGMAFYHLCGERNCMIFTTMEHVHKVLAQSIFIQIDTNSLSSSLAHHRKGENDIRWHPPHQHVYKVNIDYSF